VPDERLACDQRVHEPLCRHELHKRRMRLPPFGGTVVPVKLPRAIDDAEWDGTLRS
jgi:hypothetical protein